MNTPNTKINAILAFSMGFAVIGYAGIGCRDAEQETRSTDATDAGSDAGNDTGSESDEWTNGIPPLHIDGRFFKDPSGHTVVLRGLALADLLDLDSRENMNVEKLLDLLTDEAEGWYTRIVRLTVFPPIWLPDPDTYLKTHLKPAVAHATELGLYVIVDWHEISDAAPADQETRDFWATVAPVFANQTNVLYEVFNESEDFADPSWSTWKERAQPWVNQIREDAPDTIILIGAPMWTQSVGGAVEDPFEGENLAYVGHIYPLGTDRSLWEEGGAFAELADTRAMMITEWGFQANADPPLTGDQAGFGDPLKDFIESHRLGWTAWCADPLWGTMFDEDWQLLRGPAEMGGFTKDWLAEKKDADQPSE